MGRSDHLSPASEWRAPPVFERAAATSALFESIQQGRSDNIGAAVPLDPEIEVALSLSRSEADATLLPADLSARDFLSLNCLPWKRLGRSTIVAIADPHDIRAARMMLGPHIGKMAFAILPRETIRTAIARLYAKELAEAAEARCPAFLSCRSWAVGETRTFWKAAALAALLASILAPGLVLGLLLAWISLMNFGTMLIRGVALVESFRTQPAPDRTNTVSLLTRRDLPKISILVPLLSEDVILRRLISSLKKTDYPTHLLDVKLVLEEKDFATQLALAQIERPDWITLLEVPDAGTLKTKPRAMNFALDFCEGEIIGIYDAEDRPEPDQLHKIVDRLHYGPPDLACVQGYLDFYNTRQNWLSRCFTIEYAVWFRVLLRGVQRLRLPLPLGGTTVFFRRTHLVEVGGWDAHNVTEDADLGMRLARFGYRTEMVPTTTWEEANCEPLAWIKQRSRWLKGYAITWATHMRSPVTLAQDLGLAGFLGFQILFLGGLTSYLATPLFWLLWACTFAFGAGLWDLLPPLLWGLFFASMVIGQILMLSVAMRAVWAKGQAHLMPIVLTLSLYWPLGAIAAYRAVFEIFKRPFYWHKTRHGL